MKEHMEISDITGRERFTERLSRFAANGWKVIGYSVIQNSGTAYSHVLLEREVPQTKPKGEQS
jgi:hypothetical protein